MPNYLCWENIPGRRAFAAEYAAADAYEAGKMFARDSECYPNEEPVFADIIVLEAGYPDGWEQCMTIQLDWVGGRNRFR